MDTQTAAEHLKNGDLVVFPTETVYGIGALASDDAAVRRIFEVKGRPQQNPLILHIADRSQLDVLVREIPESAQKLMDAFWPVPLTICFDKSNQVSDLVTAGLPTVCVRNPDHPIVHDILKEVVEAVAAPSANLSGKPSTTRFQDAKRQLEDKGVFFMEGGETTIGLQSTVVDCTGEQVRILRPGFVSQSQLEECLCEQVHIENQPDIVTSPGQLLEHYAPQGELTVLMGAREKRREWLQQQDLTETLLGLVGDVSDVKDTQSVQLSEEDDLQTYASHLYGFLNSCDVKGMKKIILELPSYTDHDLFPALLNRLEKASRGNVLKLHQY